MVPDWPNRSTPSGTAGTPSAEPSQAIACDAASCTVTTGVRSGERRPQRARHRRRRSPSGRPAAASAARRRRAGPATSRRRRARRCPRRQLGGGGQHLGQHRAGGDQVHLRRVRRRARRWRRPAGTRRPAPAGAAPRRRAARGPPRTAPGPSAGWSAGSSTRRAPRPRRAPTAAASRPAGEIRPSASQSSQSSATPYAGSISVTSGSSSPTDGVIVDWCAPPSGASVTPDGVPATTNRAPSRRAWMNASSPRQTNGS